MKSILMKVISWREGRAYRKGYAAGLRDKSVMELVHVVGILSASVPDWSLTRMGNFTIAEYHRALRERPWL